MSSSFETGKCNDLYSVFIYFYMFTYIHIWYYFHFLIHINLQYMFFLECKLWIFHCHVGLPEGTFCWTICSCEFHRDPTDSKPPQKMLVSELLCLNNSPERIPVPQKWTNISLNWRKKNPCPEKSETDFSIFSPKRWLEVGRSSFCFFLEGI